MNKTYSINDYIDFCRNRKSHSYEWLPSLAHKIELYNKIENNLHGFNLSFNDMLEFTRYIKVETDRIQACTVNIHDDSYYISFGSFRTNTNCPVITNLAILHCIKQEIKS